MSSSQAAGAAPLLQDARDPTEIESQGHTANSVHIPVRDLFKNVEKVHALDPPTVA